MFTFIQRKCSWEIIGSSVLFFLSHLLEVTLFLYETVIVCFCPTYEPVMGSSLNDAPQASLFVLP